MKDPKNIMQAIDLLVREKKRKHFPSWIPWLDTILTALYLGAFVWLLYNIVQWLT